MAGRIMAVVVMSWVGIAARIAYAFGAPDGCIRYTDAAVGAFRRQPEHAFQMRRAARTERCRGEPHCTTMVPTMFG